MAGRAGFSTTTSSFVVVDHGAILADITTWGWVHLILGSIIALSVKCGRRPRSHAERPPF
jgi:hypothetical protein